MLEIQNLTLALGEKIILDRLSLAPFFGNLGVIGESGSGKSSFLKSLIVLFSSPFILEAQTLRVNGWNVLHLDQRALRMFRSRVGYVSAEIYGGFYPLNDIGCVFDSLLAYHNKKLNKKQRKLLSFEMMERVGLENLDLIWHSYIRELSGGMARRVQLALCLVCGAKILLCDEITASLDEENAQRIVQLLKEMRIPLIFATHHLSYLKELCNEVIVLQKGKIIEQNTKESFFHSSQSDYGRSLLQAWKNKC